MASAFGIFREETVVPVLHGVPKELPPVFKGKAQVLNVKKKALGDVSNTVTQKVLNTKPNDAPGKPSEGSCSSVQHSASVTCKPVVEAKEVEVKKEVEEPQAVSFDGWDFDILSKSERLSNEALDLFSSPFPLKTMSSPCTKINYDLPEFSPVVFKDEFSTFDIEDLPLEDLSLEDIPVYDVSF